MRGLNVRRVMRGREALDRRDLRRPFRRRHGRLGDPRRHGGGARCRCRGAPEGVEGGPDLLLDKLLGLGGLAMEIAERGGEGGADAAVQEDAPPIEGVAEADGLVLGLVPETLDGIEGGVRDAIVEHLGEHRRGVAPCRGANLGLGIDEVERVGECTDRAAGKAHRLFERGIRRVHVLVVEFFLGHLVDFALGVGLGILGGLLIHPALAVRQDVAAIERVPNIALFILVEGAALLPCLEVALEAVPEGGRSHLGKGGRVLVVGSGKGGGRRRLHLGHVGLVSGSLLALFGVIIGRPCALDDIARHCDHVSLLWQPVGGCTVSIDLIELGGHDRVLEKGVHVLGRGPRLARALPWAGTGWAIALVAPAPGGGLG